MPSNEPERPEMPSLQGFDDDIAKLEALVRSLDSGSLPIDQALAAYESGVSLVRTLNQQLTAAETFVEVLSRAEDGSPELTPYQDEDE